LPVFRFNKFSETARRAKRFLKNPKQALRRRLWDPEKVALRRSQMRSKKDEFKQLKKEARSRKQEEYRQLKNEIARLENVIKSNKQEIKLLERELRSAEGPAERSEYEERKRGLQQERLRLREELRAARRKGRAANIGRKKRKKTIQQEIFQLERERRAPRDGDYRLTPAGGRPASPTEVGSETGALPDFIIIGEKKCGTTFLYHLLGQHPLVQPAASKELHFFDVHFDEGIEWYRRCFPPPKQRGARRTVTGEATPYMSNRHAPGRVAQVVPEARLIALLRDPVERAYSDFQMVARKGRESRTFEEAMRSAAKAHPPSGEGWDHAAFSDGRHRYLFRSVYVDHLQRWTEFFPREQLLVLKSEDFFDNPTETLKVALEFLDLPEWEPEEKHLEGGRRNEGGYEQRMDPAARRRLEEYFEPHNQRLYDFLGTDFGW
jgi:hypothetical protein